MLLHWWLLLRLLLLLRLWLWLLLLWLSDQSRRTSNNCSSSGSTGKGIVIITTVVIVCYSGTGRRNFTSSVEFAFAVILRHCVRRVSWIRLCLLERMLRGLLLCLLQSVRLLTVLGHGLSLLGLLGRLLLCRGSCLWLRLLIGSRRRLLCCLLLLLVSRSSSRLLVICGGTLVRCIASVCCWPCPSGFTISSGSWWR